MIYPICPICLKELQVKPGEPLFGFYRFTCNCLDNSNEPCFTCYTTLDFSQIIEFHIYKYPLIFNWVQKHNDTWRLYVSNGLESFASGKNIPLTPAQGYDLLQRYQKLMVFL